MYKKRMVIAKLKAWSSSNGRTFPTRVVATKLVIVHLSRQRLWYCKAQKEYAPSTDQSQANPNRRGVEFTETRVCASKFFFLIQARAFIPSCRKVLSFMLADHSDSSLDLRYSSIPRSQLTIALVHSCIDSLPFSPACMSHLLRTRIAWQPWTTINTTRQTPCQKSKGLH